jgi:hypothetical protein
MYGLIDVPPTAIQHHDGSTNFYYGVQPHRIQYLPEQAEFSVVYSPKDGDGWQFVKYRMFENSSGMAVIERRNLTADEIAYFEEQRRLTKHDTGTAYAVDEAGV